VIAGERNYQSLNLRQKLIHQRRSIPASPASELYLYDHLRFSHGGRTDHNCSGKRDLLKQFLAASLTADHGDNRR
jgi:hypothetical protein